MSFIYVLPYILSDVPQVLLFCWWRRWSVRFGIKLLLFRCNIDYLHQSVAWIFHIHIRMLLVLTFKMQFLAHTVQVPQWNACRWLPRFINLLKLPPWSQIMPPGQWMNNFSTPVIERLYPRWYLEKLVAPTEIEYFQHGPRSSN